HGREKPGDRSAAPQSDRGRPLSRLGADRHGRPAGPADTRAEHQRAAPGISATQTRGLRQVPLLRRLGGSLVTALAWFRKIHDWAGATLTLPVDRIENDSPRSWGPPLAALYGRVSSTAPP